MANIGAQIKGAWSHVKANPLSGAMAVGMNLWMFSDAYNQNRQSMNPVFSAIGAGIETYWWSQLGPLGMAAYMGKDILGDYLPQQAQRTLGQTRAALRPFGQQTYFHEDTANRATMRARNASLIQNSKMNLRQVLGNEAAIFSQRYG